jgi:hypothetical protein
MNQKIEVIVHKCHMDGDGYCDCEDVSSIILKKAGETLPELNGFTLEEVKETLSSGQLICKECGHYGMLTKSIADAAPEGPRGYACNYESDFVICPKCCHWAVIDDPFHITPGTLV